MSSNMACTICNTNIADCSCEDRDQKLHDLAYGKGVMVYFKWCKKCDKHFARCKCDVPEFFVIHEGEEVDVSNGLETLAGDRLFIDPTRR